jgi:hypothetical protein
MSIKWFFNRATSQVWSVDAVAYVAADNADYVAFTTGGGTAMQVPHEALLYRRLKMLNLPTGDLIGNVPATVPMNKALKVLVRNGVTEDDVYAFIDAQPEPQKTDWAIDFRRMTEVPRSGELVAAMQAYKGWTDRQVDAMFFATTLL